LFNVKKLRRDLKIKDKKLITKGLIRVFILVKGGVGF